MTTSYLLILTVSYKCCYKSRLSESLCPMMYSSLGRSPTVISHNVKGLNTPEKRSGLIRELKKGRPHFAFLQETHFKTHKVSKLTDHYFTEAYHATNDLAKSKRVSILVSREASFELTDRLTDPEGRYLFLRGNIVVSPSH